jgi:hypothetical protein
MRSGCAAAHGACCTRRYLPLVGPVFEGGAAGGAERHAPEAVAGREVLEAAGSHAQDAGGRLAVRDEGEGGGRKSAALKRGKGPARWRVKYKVPGGEASQSGFETTQAALAWGRDREAKVRAGTWTDPAAGEITVSEWIDRWKAMQDVGLSTTANREYQVRRFILPYWGTRQLNSLTGEEITVWEHRLPAKEQVSRSTAKDARSLLHTILGDAAAAKPPLIPFNPAVRLRNRERVTALSARP